MQDELHSEKERKIWSKMSNWVIIYVFWELNESLLKIQEQWTAHVQEESRRY